MDSWIIPWSAAAQAFSALVVMFFTGLLVKYNKDLLKATKEAADAATVSAETAKAALAMTQRALVLLETVSLEPSGPLSKDSIAVAQVRNFSGVLATNLRIAFSLSVVEDVVLVSN